MANGLVWEPHVVRSLEEHVKPGTVALDVGAYIGTHAMLMGRPVGPGGRIYAFEPPRTLHREVRRNMHLNELASVTALKYAVGAQNCTVELNPPKLAPVVVAAGEKNDPHRYGAKRRRRRRGSGRRPSGDAHIGQLRLRERPPDQVDVEGFEDEVLAGAERLIRESRPVILIKILGGAAYPGAPTLRRIPPAGTDELAIIHATWRTLEAWGYNVRPVLDYDTSPCRMRSHDANPLHRRAMAARQTPPVDQETAHALQDAFNRLANRCLPIE